MPNPELSRTVDDAEPEEVVSAIPSTGEVSIMHAGMTSPTVLPKDVAIKYAALVLRKAGCIVKLNQDSLIARFKPISNHPMLKHLQN